MSFAQAGLHNIQDLVATHAITESVNSEDLTSRTTRDY